MIDITSDYTIWDNTEPVGHVSVRTAGNITTGVPAAFRSTIMDKEQAVSGGRYVSTDVGWNLPAASLGSVVPKPADTIEDSDSRTWTVLDVKHVGLGGSLCHFRCLCRNNQLAFDLYEELEVWRPVNSQDAGGGRVATFSVLYSGIQCRFQEIVGDSVDERGQRGRRRQYQVFVSEALPGLMPNSDQVRASGVVYELRSYQNPSRIDELQVLTCEVVP